MRETVEIWLAAIDGDELIATRSRLPGDPPSLYTGPDGREYVTVSTTSRRSQVETVHKVTVIPLVDDD